ncbi:LOW QUALITY PROTEIN: radiation-inducible immediate-early gene IEX-1 [Dermochelys coriacea]|uniref:LOW QUALITY PROTEIN: radiation-inducible immediate-early gene IEX-1 n=1 Tax=Dermochelys coriacea TaxID=27794 RepID=UPI0018E8AC98|nr:LOW QUALITY PROTEIN: radiation-inducible immediate-early gene IEX-1 [Dermochelys coriacea]
MNALYGATSMCLGCEPRMPALPRAEPPPHGRGPQYFTFDTLPAISQTPSRRNPARGRKRLRKVLYPPVVKRYYPAKERSQAKRLLFILLTIIFYQVYNADEDLALGPEQGVRDCSAESGGSRSETPLSEVLLTPLEVPEMANATSLHGGHEAAESNVEISQFLEQNPAAF